MTEPITLPQPETIQTPEANQPKAKVERPLTTPTAAAEPKLANDDPHNDILAMANGKYQEKQLEQDLEKQDQQPEQNSKTTKTEEDRKTEEEKTLKEISDHKDEVDEILSGAGEVFLDRKQPDFLITVMARQAIPTPLGNEIRREVLRQIRSLEFSNMKEIQARIQEFNLEPPSGQPPPLEQYIKDYNLRHQENPVPDALLELINSGEQPDFQILQELFKTMPEFKTELWHEATGGELTIDPAKPEELIKAAGINATSERSQAAQQMFRTMAQPAETNGPNLAKIVGSSFTLALMFSNMITSLASEGQGAATGH